MVVDFEGQQHEFPDDFTDAEVQAALSNAQPASAPVPPTAGQPVAAEVPLPQSAPLPKDVSSYPLQPEVQGAGRGLVSMVAGLDSLNPVGAIRNTAALVSPYVGGPKIPTMQGEMIAAGTKAAEAAGVPVADYSHAPWKEQLRTNLADFGVQAGVGATGLLNAARIRAAEIAAGSAHKPFDSFLRAYMGTNPAPTLVGDTVAAAGSATAKTAVDQTRYKDNPLAEGAAILAGGAGGVTLVNTVGALARGASGAIRRLANIDIAPINVDPVTNLPVTGDVADTVAQVLQKRAAYPDAASRMQTNANELKALDADVALPSPAALSEDHGLRQLESAVSNQSTDGLTRFRDYNSKIRDSIDRVVPDGADPNALLSAVQREANARNAAAEADVARTQRGVRRLDEVRLQDGEAIAQNRGQEVPASQRLDQAIVDQGYLPARTEKNRLYNEAVPPDTPVDLTGARDAAGEVAGNVAKLPPSMRGKAVDPALLDDMAQAGPATYDEARQTRMALSEERNRARDAGDFGRADNIAAIRKPYNEAIDAANPVAEQNYRENFAPTYRPGPGDEAAKFTRQIDRDPTRSQTPPSQTAGRFLSPGQPEKAAALQRMIEGAENPKAGQTAAREYLLADMARSGAVDANGRLNARAMRAWQENWGDVDSVVPGFGAGLTETIARAGKGQRMAGEFAAEVEAAGRRANVTREEINSGALGRVLKADPDKAVASLMSDPNAINKNLDEVLRAIGGDTAARDGLKAAVSRYMADKTTSNATQNLRPGDRRGPVSQSAMEDMLGDKNTAAALAKVFSPEEMNILQAARRSLSLANIERLRTSSGSDTAEKAGILSKFLETPLGKGTEVALRLKYGMLKAGGMLATARRATAGMVGGPDPDEVARLMQRAIAEPELMGLLLGRKLPVGSPTWNKKLNQILAVGEGARDTDNQQQ